MKGEEGEGRKDGGGINQGKGKVGNGENDVFEKGKIWIAAEGEQEGRGDEEERSQSTSFQFETWPWFREGGFHPYVSFWGEGEEEEVEEEFGEGHTMD